MIEHKRRIRDLSMRPTSQGVPPHTIALAKVAKAAGELFGVAPDEVAVLRLNAKGKTLRFVIPEKLAAVGTIPLAAPRPWRRVRPANGVRNSRTISAPRGTPLFLKAFPGRDPSEMIHKIMSAPIMDGAQVLGVVQISRKGRSSNDAGQDFTQKDLRVLTSISPALERFLKLCPAG